MGRIELKRRVREVNMSWGTTRLCVVPEEGGRLSVWCDGEPLVRNVSADEAWRAVVEISYRWVAEA